MQPTDSRESIGDFGVLQDGLEDGPTHVLVLRVTGEPEHVE